MTMVAHMSLTTLMRMVIWTGLILMVGLSQI
ncbi:hypothetical protein SME36J_43220 [Serratia marcescens]|nr:hypothetical protein SME36J_43220 [Serratia marcescens]